MDDKETSPNKRACRRGAIKPNSIEASQVEATTNTNTTTPLNIY